MSKSSDETRAKISATLKGRKLSDETRQKMSAARIDKKHGPKSLEERAKLSAALKGRRVSPEALENMKAAQRNRTLEHQLNLTAGNKKSRTPEVRAKISATLKEKLSSPEARAAVGERMKGKMTPAARAKMSKMMQFYIKGGETAEALAVILCPAGFVREHRIQWSDHGFDYFRLDFAHLEGKVCIELDGPHHKKTQEYDAMRDTILRSMGWRIIRIKHE